MARRIGSVLQFLPLWLCCVRCSQGVKVYFGSGCFWHVQHEFIKAEQQVLGRADTELTSIVGYAGGKTVNHAGKVCYGDYESHGHTEVVQVDVPETHMTKFGQAFWDLFVGKNRVDTMDIGPDYRAALGLPNGTDSPFFAEIQAAQTGHVDQPFTMEAGQGNDPDTLGKALVYVYDTEEYPFYQGEMYHQFHDDFMPGGQYPQSYNDLQAVVAQTCLITPTGCYRDVAPQPAHCGGGETGVIGEDGQGRGGHGEGGGSGGSGGSFFQDESATGAPTTADARVFNVLPILFGLPAFFA